MITNKLLISVMFFLLLVGAVSAAGMTVNYPADGGVYNELVDHIELNLAEGFSVGEESLCWYDPTGNTSILSETRTPFGDGSEENPLGNCFETNVPLRNNVTAEEGLNTWAIHNVALINQWGGLNGYTTETISFWVDLTAPEITLLGSDPQIITVGNEYVELGATATDNYDGDLTESIVIDASFVDTNIEGIQYVYYNVTDSAGNSASVIRTVIVSPNGGEIEIGTGDITVINPDYIIAYTNQDSFELRAEISGESSFPVLLQVYREAGPYSSGLISLYDEDEDGIVSYTFPLDLEGSYRYTFYNLDTSVSGMIIKNTLLPEITLLGDNPQTITVGSAYAELGATAFAYWPGDITEDIIINSSGVNTNAVGTYVVTYTVTDKAGNTATETRTVNVVAVSSPPRGGSSSCNTGWECTSWSSCIDGEMTRTCTLERSGCNPRYDKPVESLVCTIFEEEPEGDGLAGEEVSSDGTDLGELAGITGGAIGTTGKVAFGALIFVILIGGTYTIVRVQRNKVKKISKK